MTSFLFHIGCEDIPATYQKDAEEQLYTLLKKTLEKEFSFLKYSTMDIFIALRHVAFRLNDISIKEGTEEKKGPLVSLGSDVFQKFLHSHDLSENQCYIKKNPKGDFWIGCINYEKKKLSEVLQTFVTQILRSFSWPKMMNWPQSPDPWVRPVRFLTALLDNNMVPIHFFGKTAGNLLQGHRLLEFMRNHKLILDNHHSIVPIISTKNNSEKNLENTTIIDKKNNSEKNLENTTVFFPEENHNNIMGSFFHLQSSEYYEEALNSIGIMASKKNHKKYIEKILQDLLDPLDLCLHDYHFENLLEENMGLVSWPVALLGSFEERFLHLPPKVILNTLGYHQRCFCVVKKGDTSKTLINKFVVISDGIPQGTKETTPEKGYERVVHARLSDALFFCQEDLKKPLISYNDALYKRRFFDNIGSFGHKVQRLTQRAYYLGKKYSENNHFPEIDQKNFQALVERCKSSMACSLVDEYPELQGVMGAYYGKQQNLSYGEVLESYGTWHNRDLYKNEKEKYDNIQNTPEDYFLKLNQNTIEKVNKDIEEKNPNNLEKQKKIEKENMSLIMMDDNDNKKYSLNPLNNPCGNLENTQEENHFQHFQCYLSPLWLQNWFFKQKEGFSPLDVLPSLEKEDIYSALLSFLDTTDTLVGFFSLGKIPTGSKDPMALRRCCHGALKSLLALKESIDLSSVFFWSLETYKGQGFLQEPWPQWHEALRDFFIERLDYLYPQIYGFSLNVHLKKSLLNNETPLDPIHITALSLFEHMISSHRIFCESYHRIFSLLKRHHSQENEKIQKPDILSPGENQLESLLESHWGPWPTFSQLSSWAESIKFFFDTVYVQEEPYFFYRIKLLENVMKKLPFFYELTNIDL